MAEGGASHPRVRVRASGAPTVRSMAGGTASCPADRPGRPAAAEDHLPVGRRRAGARGHPAGHPLRRPGVDAGGDRMTIRDAHRSRPHLPADPGRLRGRRQAGHARPALAKPVDRSAERTASGFAGRPRGQRPRWPGPAASSSRASTTPSWSRRCGATTCASRASSSSALDGADNLAEVVRSVRAPARPAPRHPARPPRRRLEGAAHGGRPSTTPTCWSPATPSSTSGRRSSPRSSASRRWPDVPKGQPWKDGRARRARLEADPGPVLEAPPRSVDQLDRPRARRSSARSSSSSTSSPSPRRTDPAPAVSPAAAARPQWPPAPTGRRRAGSRTVEGPGRSGPDRRERRRDQVALDVGVDAPAGVRPRGVARPVEGEQSGPGSRSSTTSAPW